MITTRKSPLFSSRFDRAMAESKPATNADACATAPDARCTVEHGRPTGPLSCCSHRGVLWGFCLVASLRALPAVGVCGVLS